jgi:acetoacetate decarboxylase
MQFEANTTYFMPVSFGPVRPLKAGVFEDVLSVSTSYLTDRDALAAFLPPRFEPDDEPLVTVYYRKCSRVNFLAGGCYSMMGLNLATYFNGSQDQVIGDYSLVLWENHIFPILRGRELLGVPKLLADIPDPDRVGDDWCVQTSEQGHLLLEMSVKGAQPMDKQAIEKMMATQKERAWLSWRYFPNVNGIGPALSEATLIGWDSVITAGWQGDGSVKYGDVTWETNPMSGDIVPALKALEVKEYVESTVTYGSASIIRALHRVLH